LDRFLPYTDTLGELLQKEAENLLGLMQTIKVDEIGLSEHGLVYFKGSHFKRLFFSIQTSAHILYNSISLVKKEPKDVTIMDYGAGIGSLYILAKMIGCKRVIYNDILEEWKQNALLIAKAINKDVDDYIVGNIDETLQIINNKAIVIDIITSRNVIEHIYKLDKFYTCISNYQPKAIVYSSTTANFNNPAMNIQHLLLHRRIEKVYYQQRIDFIQNNFPNIEKHSTHTLAVNTRGYEKSELQQAVEKFIEHKTNPQKNYYYTNTCDITYGVWAENLLPFKVHKQMIESNGKLMCMIKPGFWDTHYHSAWKNLMGKFFNQLICNVPFLSFLLAPFVYVIALPNQQNK